MTADDAYAWTSGGETYLSYYYTNRSFLGGFDYNNDGIDDIAIANGGYDSAYTDAGAVLVYFGPISSGEIDLTDLSSADLSYSPNVASAYAGSDLSVGDSDGDGLPELFIGQRGAGTSVLIAGGLSGALDDSSTGVSSFSYGFGVFVGDMSGDGKDDLVVKSGATSPYTYFAWSDSGLTVDTTNSFTTIPPYTSVFGAQNQPINFDGDGVGDLLSIGFDYPYSFTVYLGTGSTQTLPSASPLALLGHSSSAWVKVANIGDLNDDGYDDAALMDRGMDSYHTTQGTLSGGGVVGIVYGASTPPTVLNSIKDADLVIQGSVANEEFGADVASLDVDSDGYLDLAFSGNASEDPVLFYGPLSSGSYHSTDAPVWFTATGKYSGVANAGDVNADGFEDLLIGNIEHTQNGVYLYLGTEL
jgi:hypothetical protein